MLLEATSHYKTESKNLINNSRKFKCQNHKIPCKDTFQIITDAEDNANIHCSNTNDM